MQILQESVLGQFDPNKTFENSFGGETLSVQALLAEVQSEWQSKQAHEGSRWFFNVTHHAIPNGR